MFYREGPALWYCLSTQGTTARNGVSHGDSKGSVLSGIPTIYIEAVSQKALSQIPVLNAQFKAVEFTRIPAV